MRKYIIIHIYNGACERFINMCRHKSIEMWDIKRMNEGISAKTTVKDFYRLRDVCRVTGNRVRVCKRVGMAFTVFKYRKHYSFVVGMLVACILITVWSKFVWDITFVGNSKYTEGVLLEYLNSTGIYAGMLLKDINCADIEAGIRNQYNEITWVSAKISGTKLEINIKENDVLGTGIVAEAKERDIVASEAGIVHSIITRKGTPLVKAGDKVEKGQILVSGVVKIMDDAGNHVANMYAQSDADILIKGKLDYSDKLPLDTQEKIYTGKIHKKVVLGFTNTNWELGLLLKAPDNADVETVINPVKLTESFILPIYFGRKNYYEYEIVNKRYDEESAGKELEKHFLQYIKELSQNEVQIPEYDVKMYKEGDGFALKGTLDVIAPMVEYKPVTDVEIIENEENKEVQ